MSIRELLDFPKLKWAERNVRRNATLLGENYMFGPRTRVGLTDGAKKENVIIEDNCWFLGQIMVQTDGKVVMRHHSKIGIGCQIKAIDYVEIGAYTAVGNNVYFVDNNNHPVNPEFRKQMRLSDYYSDMRLWKHSPHKPIIVGENCWIGENARICKGVTIGDNAIIAANSVVTKDVPANSIAAGNPAKIVKTDIDQIPAPTSSPEFNKYLEKKQLKNED